MNDLEKAARLALDALENLGWHGSERECDEAITALRAALKQAEPVVDYTLLHDVAEKDGVRAALELKDKLKQQAEPVSALSRYSETAAEGPVIDMVDALERLRFFCSLAMTEGDWLDVEPFFDDAEQELAKLEQQAEPVAEPLQGGLTDFEIRAWKMGYDAAKAELAEPVQAEPVAATPKSFRVGYMTGYADGQRELREKQQAEPVVVQAAVLESLKAIVEFADAPLEAKRPDVFFIRINNARAAIARAERAEPVEGAE